MNVAFDILLDCCRARVAGRTIASLPCDAGTVAPEAVIRLANRHRLAPIVCSQVLQLPPQSLPGGYRERFQAARLACTARSLGQIERLLAIRDAFASEGIRAMPFKGPVLGVQAYGDACLRQFDDLDFLVDPRHMRPARACLRELGFEPALYLSPAEEDAHLRAGWGFTMRDRKGGGFVELDTGIGARYFSFRPSFEQLGAEQETVLLDRTEIRTLAAPWLLLFLCLHGTKHIWDRLSWVADIAALLEARPDIGQDAALRRARAWGCGRMLLLGLSLSRELAGLALSPAVERAAAADRRLPWLLDRARGKLLQDTPAAPGHGELFRYNIAARARLGQRLRYALLLGLTPTYSDWKALPLPRPLFPLYPLLRPFRIAWKYARPRPKKKEPAEGRVPR